MFLCVLRVIFVCALCLPSARVVPFVLCTKYVCVLCLIYTRYVCCALRIYQVVCSPLFFYMCFDFSCSCALNLSYMCVVRTYVNLRAVPGARGQVDAKRIYREMFILRHMRNDEIIHLRDVIMPPPPYDDFRDLYLVSVCFL